ncbi:helix-turn-helix transcriptional regulator [Acrocarpospora catenulata]|uniref:helix-turn-helix transcriptional regulator n=1 Tax=Acrocarpospora catenulata TaxID=2836182 RepID=UPI001BD9F7EB|nr:helix-turn-helix transcriptional regulator [Acrocarpospora catenulata]
MTGTATAQRLGAAIKHADAHCATADEFLAAIYEQVRKVVPFDGGLWFGVDPSTLLAAPPGRLEHLEASLCQRFWDIEFRSNDVTPFRDLARRPGPVASLRVATEDKPIRSPRYRDIMRPLGYEEEARIAFRTGTTTWAVAALYRDRGRPAFDQDELRLLASISQTVGVAMRARSVSPGSRAAEALLAPGVLLLDANGMLMSANVHAKAWLRQLFGLDLGEQPWSSGSGGPALLQAWTFLHALASQARAVMLGYEDGPARLRCRDRDGRWVMLHASCMDDGNPDSPIAIVIEPAQSGEIAPIMLDAYGLTAREREVLGGIARGLSTPEIAAELFLSSHTVRDYIKSVFEKVGVSSRGELTAKLFAEHYFDAFKSRLVQA